MPKQPEADVARTKLMALRFTDVERSRVTEQRVARGKPDDSSYVRGLIEADGRELEEGR